MQLEDVYRMPGHLFRRMQQIAVSIFMEECEAFDLTPVQFAALAAVAENPGVDATRLSALIAFDKSTLGGVIERLEAKALIERTPSPSDKRLKHIHLAPRGWEILAAVEPVVRRAQERMLAPLSPADRDRLTDLLSQLVDLNNEASRVPLRLTGVR